MIMLYLNKVAAATRYGQQQMRSRHHDLVVIAPTAPAAAGSAGLPVADRDGCGRFRAGGIGGPGRPRGSRNKLGEDFIAAVYELVRARAGCAGSGSRAAPSGVSQDCRKSRSEPTGSGAGR